MATQVASLMIDVAANVAQLRKDFDQAAGTVRGFGDTVTALGRGIAAAFSIHEVIAFGERIQDEIDAMADMAENLKIAVDDFQTLQNAALLAGQSVEATGNAMAKFNVFIGKASEGNKDAIETLNALGVTINNLDGSARSTTTRLQLIAQAITSIEDPAKRSAAEVAIFGKSGQAVSAILEQWKRPLGEVNRELEAMGLVHSPEVIKRMAEMSDQADRAAKQMDVLFAPLYAAAKSAVFEAIAGGFRLIANAVNAIDAGNLDAIVRTLAALALIPTIVGAPAGVALLQGIKQPLEIVDDQIAATQKRMEGLEATIRQLYDSDQRGSAAAVAAAEKYRAEQQKLIDLQSKRAGLTGAVIDMSRPPGAGRNPAVVGGSGVDKFAEAQRRLLEETKGLNLAIAEFQQRVASGYSTKEAERFAKLQNDIASKTAQMIKDLTPQQADIIAPQVKALEELRFKYEELKRLQGEADAVNRRYGDGLAEQQEAIARLNELKAQQLIGEREYAAALDEVNQRAEEQRLINEGLGEGISQIAAGWQYAAARMSESMSSFQVGQQLFTNSVNLMSDAISEFVTTGVLDFEKLAQGFAKMLADMATQLIIHQALKSILGIGSAAVGSPAALVGPAGAQPVSSGGFWDWLGGIFGGNRAVGGSVMAGVAYNVGEQGPERFIPTVPGRVESMDSSSDTGSVTVNLDMRKAEGVRDTTAAMEFGRRVKAAVIDVIQNEKRPGGTLYA